MKTLVDQLAQYADYHRDRRNIATHFVGIPMIVLAVQVLLSRPALQAGAFGYLLKEQSRELLVEQFDRVEAGTPLYRIDSPAW